MTCDVNTTEATTGATALMCVHIETSINTTDLCRSGVRRDTSKPGETETDTRNRTGAPKENKPTHHRQPTSLRTHNKQQAMSRPRINHACFHVPCSRASMSSHVPMYHTLHANIPTCTNSAPLQFRGSRQLAGLWLGSLFSYKNTNFFISLYITGPV